MKKILLAVLAVSACFGCEKIIEIDVPAKSAGIVMQSFLNPDSTLKVHLSKSAFILDELPEHIGLAGATVSVYEGEEWIGDLQYTDYGFYELPGFKPDEGKTYRLEAQKEGMGRVEASETVPARVPISEIRMDTLTTEENGYQYHELEITFYIDDPLGQNYYIPYAQLNTEIRETNPYDSTEYIYYNSYPLQVTAADPAIESVCAYECISIVSDEYFDGERYKIRMHGSLPDYPAEILQESSLSIRLYNVSPSYYLYYVTLQKSKSSGEDPFSEPTQVFSNVEGGYGVVTALNAFEKDFK